VDKIFVRQGCSSFRGMTLLLARGFCAGIKNKIKIIKLLVVDVVDVIVE
jgi:hypothetical protein